MIYRNAREAQRTKPEGQGLSAETQWRAIQPGFVDEKHPTHFLSLKQHHANYNTDVFWDGTFNQPLIPLADRMHKDSRKYW